MTLLAVHGVYSIDPALRIPRPWFVVRGLRGDEYRTHVAEK